MSPEGANGMMRRCIHSLSLGLWPIQLPRRGSLGYVLLFLALSYLYRPLGRSVNARKRCHRHSVAGRGKRDDTPVHSLPQSRPLADPAPSKREPWVRAFIFSTILSLQAYAKQANAVRPYGSWSTFLPVGNPQTFRREQAPALRCAVYLFARGIKTISFPALQRAFRRA